MPSRPIYYLWDACIFLAYFNNEPERADTVAALLEEIRESRGQRKIAASVLSQIEVAYSAQEMSENALDGPIDDRIQSFWRSDLIELVDVNPWIADKARTVIRKARLLGFQVRSIDATQIATALWLSAVELFSYDPHLKRLDSQFGVRIRDPYVTQLRLPSFHSMSSNPRSDKSGEVLS